MTHSPPSSSPEIWSARDLRDDPHQARDKADRVEAMFSAIARSYDLNNRVHSLGRDQAWRRRAVVLAEAGPGDDVLDVACGTGDLTEAFAQAGVASVTGLDFAAPMLELAAAKSDGREREAGRAVPRYQRGDAMELPFRDGAFDIVSIAFGIRNVTDPGLAVDEMRRVLRPGGRLIVLEFSRPGNPLLAWANDLYCRRIMPLTATWLARDRSGAYRYLPRSIESFLDRDAMAKLMLDRGFRPVTQHPMTFGVCVGYLGRVV